ncbi:N-acetylmuramoyl-L-alanine amidase family protein [Paenibacillus polygoni]|uniref:N-acetylmuramoyl-L-alanine amidase family protein n=1 Tax=Paenibacillus polygoni TaxID=3050112 RepID=A0ABY8WX01_9BACL|nr:N-acetylmuramoyl-L-alanine amidase family protein [Paenibacillus polygoni]WIV17497.1 N-acetylmuramoyl-L-alanine amidase family protein [Paenibacillus polygoni]
MKKTMILFLFSLLLCSIFPNIGHASSNPPKAKIILDGKEIKLPSPAQVSIINNSVMIPIRVVAENLNFKVTWDQKIKRVKIQNDTDTLTLTVNKKEALINDIASLLEVSPRNLNNTVVVPLRFVSENMGLAVKWDNKNKVVTLTSSIPVAGSNGIEEGTYKEPVKQVNDMYFANNQLVVSLDGDVKPSISTLANPQRIVVDIPNATFSSSFSQSLNIGTIGKLDVSGYSTVSEVRYSLFSRDPEVVRIVIVAEEEIPFEFQTEMESNTLVVDVTEADENSTFVPLPAPIPIPPVDNSGRKTVVIDPGHGGSDPGTIGITNTHEKDFTLALSLKVETLLQSEPEINVVMTRDEDVYPTRTERVALANQLKADLFVSIHGNSVLASPQASGTESYYYQRSSSKDLAKVIHKHLVKALGFKDRGVKEGNYQVIRETTMPAALLEIGFLSNLAEEEALFTEAVQDKAAQAIVDGIKEYLGI